MLKPRVACFGHCFSSHFASQRFCLDAHSQASGCPRSGLGFRFPNATQQSTKLDSGSSARSADAGFGYTDFSKEAAVEEKFLAVPNAKLAGEELKTLTAEPHMAATP